MRVAIVGSGYVGLVTGACLAARGHDVVCVDRDAERVRAIEAGRPPFHEPGLEALLRREAGRRLRGSTELAAAVRAAELTMIATGTPFDGAQIDLSAVIGAAREIGSALAAVDGYHVVVVKSTVVPGTTDGVVRAALEGASGKRAGIDFGLGMNPEFLSEGTAIDDFERPDRLVLGGLEERTRAALEALYRDFVGVPVMRTNNATAELVKYASNALLATLISFANELADLAELTPDVDATEVMRGVHLMRELRAEAPLGEGSLRASREPTPSLGASSSTAPSLAGLTSFLLPGCGFGGSCLPKDVSALSAWGGMRGAATPLLDAVLRVNRARPGRVVRSIEAALGPLEGRRVTVLGLAFKPETDDVRESPALPLIRELRERGASVCAYDPVARENAERALGPARCAMATSLEQALADAEAIVLVTRWEEFRALPQLLEGRAAMPLIVDARRVLEPERLGPEHRARYVAPGLRPRSGALERPHPVGRGASEHRASEQGVTQHGASQHGVTQHGASQHGVTQHGVTQHGVTQHGVTQHGVTQHGVTQHGAREQEGREGA